MAKIKEPEARALYIAMGPTRTLRAVIASLPPERRVIIRSFQSWSSKHSWVRQAKEYDERTVAATTDELRKVHVKAGVAAMKDASLPGAMDRIWVLDRLRQVFERCMQSTPVFDTAGKPTGEYKFNASGAIKAVELIGRDQGMFVDRQEIGTPGEFERLNDDELANTIAKLQGSIGRGAAGNTKASRAPKPSRVH